jgi:uncharacterized protein YyaL (SSP411 family)
MPNKLAGETSPYLLQHKDNPVDWYPWGPEALDRAKSEDKPILLSIGYSACHWCHVMAHESFENPEIAAIMNENFVNIKVDREERPDLDSIYMESVQAMTGHGGWPMTVFLTPEGVPFYGGTYFPATEGRGMTGFPRVLRGVSAAYREEPDKVRQNAAEMQAYLQQGLQLKPSKRSPDASVLDEAARNSLSQFDRVNGGTEGAPKFPQPMNIEYLLKQYKRTGDTALLAAAELTLDKMAGGGIYDHLGGGFHRYSVDDVWLVPHFEKMLYDNALLARVYLAAYQLTGNPNYRMVAEETLDYVVREMTSPEGGFYSTQDADSEGEEGKFYLWTPGEIDEVLGPEDGKQFNRIFDVSSKGNFEGKNILHLEWSLETFAAASGLPESKIRRIVQEGKRKLLAAREKRTHPGRDEKVVVAWNGLALRAFAEAASILHREDYRQVALNNAEFVTTKLLAQAEDGARLMRTYKDGKAHIDAFAEDYASYANGLISLYETTFDPKWITAGKSLVETLLDHFWDESGGFFSTADFHEALVARPKEYYDNATPSGNSEAAEALLRLYLLTAEPDYESYAIGTIQPLLEALAKAPTAFGRMLSALDMYLSSPVEVALLGDLDSPEMAAMLEVVWKKYIPNKVIAASKSGDEEAAKVVPLLEGRKAIKGQVTAYVCRNYICETPATDPATVERQMAGVSGDVQL